MADSKADGGSEAVDSLDRPVRVADEVRIRARSRARDEVPMFAECRARSPVRVVVREVK